VLAGGERGLLSMAFPPDYATSGRFYVHYTARNPSGAVTIVEYRTSSDADAADAALPMSRKPSGPNWSRAPRTTGVST
jgi:hypothetical protein